MNQTLLVGQPDLGMNLHEPLSIASNIPGLVPVCNSIVSPMFASTTALTTLAVTVTDGSSARQPPDRRQGRGWRLQGLLQWP
jgi:hypothetical protein